MSTDCNIDCQVEIGIPRLLDTGEFVFVTERPDHRGRKRVHVRVSNEPPKESPRVTHRPRRKLTKQG